VEKGPSSAGDDETQRRNAKEARYIHATEIYSMSQKLAGDSFYRTAFTSRLVEEFLRGITVHRSPSIPCLSSVSLSPEPLRQVTVLKYFTFFFVIRTPQIQAWEANGYRIVSETFDLLWADEAGRSLPTEVRDEYARARKGSRVIEAKRMICDFIAGMSDTYAVEFYGRLTSLHPSTIFKMM
jgi:dGTPase